MNFAQGQAEVERLWRRQKTRRDLELHITIARVNKGWTTEIELPTPPHIELTLGRIHLVESSQIDGEAHHQIVCEPVDI